MTSIGGRRFELEGTDAGKAGIGGDCSVTQKARWYGRSFARPYGTHKLGRESESNVHPKTPGLRLVLNEPVAPAIEAEADAGAQRLVAAANDARRNRRLRS